MPNLNPTVDHEKDQNEQWFANTIMKATMISGLAFGGYKFYKGPHGKLIQQYFNENAFRVMHKEAEKATGEIIDIKDLSKNFNATTNPYQDKFDESKIVPALQRNNVQGEMLQNSLIRKIEKKEDQLYNWGITSNVDIRTRKSIKGAVRLEALSEYFQKFLPAQQNDLTRILELKNLDANDDVEIHTLHEKYLTMDPYYADIYNKRLGIINKKYQQANVAFKSNKSNLNISSDIKRFILGGEFESNIAQEAERLAFGGGMQQFKTKKSIQEALDITSKFNKDPTFKITSGSLSSKKWVSNPLTDSLGNIDYTGALNSIKTTLADLIKVPEQTGVQNANISFVQKGTRDKKQWISRINLQHENGKWYNLEIPITQWGFMPGSTPSSGWRLDGFKLRHTNFGLGTISENNVYNTSKIVMEEVNNFLDGSIITNNFKHTPSDAIKKLRNRITNLVTEPSVARGEIRDMYQLLSVKWEHDDFGKQETISQQTMHRMVSDAMNSMRNIKTISDISRRTGHYRASTGSLMSGAGITGSPRGAISINLDFETLSKDFSDTGTIFLAGDPTTQLTKGSITVTEYSNKAARLIGSEEMTSDHGYSLYKEMMNNGRNPLSDRVISFLKGQLPEGVIGSGFTNEQIFDAWGDWIKSETEKYQKGLKGTSLFRRGFARSGSFKNNREFMEAYLDKLEAVIDHYARSGKEVFITTKNGRGFDLEIIRAYRPALLSKIDRSIIDLQSVSYYQQKGYGGVKSLRQNKLIMQMLGRLGISDNIDIDSDLSKDPKARRVMKQLMKRLGYTNTFDKFFEEVNNLGFTKAHSSSSADTIWSEFLLGGWIERASDKSDEMFGGLERTTNFIKGGRKTYEEQHLSFMEHEGLKIQLPGGHQGLLSRSGLSSNWLAQGFSSLLSLHQMMPYADNPLAKQWNQYNIGAKFTLSDAFKRQNKIKKGQDITQTAEYKRRFGNPLKTKTALEVENFYKYNTVGSRAGEYSHEVMMRGVYTYNPFYGKEGFTAFSNKAFKNIQMVQERMIPLDAKSVGSNAVLADKIMGLARKIHAQVMKEADVVNGGEVTRELYQKVAEEVAISENIHIPAGQKVAVSMGDMGVQTVETESGGKIMDVIFDKDANGIMRAHAKLVMTADDKQIGRLPINARFEGSKAASFISTVNDTISEKMASDGVDFTANADFLAKGYIGVFKDLSTRRLLERIDYLKTKGNANDKIRAERLIKAMSYKTNSTVSSDGGLVINDQVENIHNQKGKVLKSHAQKTITGTVDVQMNDIQGWMKNAGMTWNDDMMHQWYGQFANAPGGSKSEQVKSGMQVVESQLKTYLTELEKTTKMEHGENYKSIFEMKSNLAYSMFLPKRGSATLLAPHKDYLTGQITLAVNAVSRGQFYGANIGRGVSEANIKVRSEDLDNLKTGGYLSKGMVDHIGNNALYYKNPIMHKAYRATERFVDSLFAKASSIANLNLEQIMQLTDTNRWKEKILSAKKRVMDDNSISNARGVIASLLGGLDYLESTGGLDEMDSIINEVKSFEANKDITKNERLMDLSSIASLGEVSRTHGVISLAAAKKDKGLNLWKFDNVRAMTEGMGPIMGKEATPIYGKVDKLLDMVTRVFQETGSDNFIHSLVVDEDGKHKVVNRLEWDKNKPKKVIGFHLNNIILRADESPEILANMISDKAGYVSPESRARLNIMNNYKEFLQDSEKVMNGVWSGNQGHSHLNGQEQTIMRMTLMDMLRNTKFDKDSKLWEAGNVSELIGVRAPIQGSESVLTRAYQLKNNDFKGLKLSKHKMKQARTIVDKILNQDANTIMVTRSTFEKMKVNTVEDGLAKTIPFAQHIQSIAEESSGTETEKQLRQYLNDVKTGKRTANGFMTRYPLQQAGGDAILNTQIQVIDNDIAPYLGISPQALHAHTVFSTMMNADHDGDIGYFGVKNIATLQQINIDREESRGALQKVINRGEFNKRITEDPWSKIINFDVNTNMSTVIDYKNGKTVINKINNSQINTGNLLKSMQKTIDNAASLALDPDSAQREVNRLGHAALARNQIGAVTNIARQRIGQVMSSGLVDSPNMKYVIGNVAHGLAGVTQDIVDMAKHDTNISKAQKAFEYFAFMDPKNMDGRNEFKQMFTKKIIDSYGGPESKVEGRNVNDLASEVFNQMEQAIISREAQNKKGGDVWRYSRSLDNVRMGRSGADWMDYVISGTEQAFNNIEERALNQQLTPMSTISGMGDNIGKMLSDKIGLNNISSATWRRGGKVGAIMAGTYMALNFFRPNQMSNSLNPLDAFTDLGHDIDGNNTRIFSNVQLDKSLPLDMVNASFSKQAYIKMNSNESSYKKGKAQLINDMLSQAFGNLEPNVKQFSSNRNSKQDLTRTSSYFSGTGSSGRADLY